MGNPTVFFEIAGPDQKGLIDFYTQLFDWKTSDVPGDMPYSMVTAGEGGARGGIGPTPDGSAGHVTFYVGVDDVGAALDKAESLGGSKIVGPMEVPGGNIGLFTDPEGHVVGLWAGSMEGNGESAGTPVIWFEVIGKDGAALRSFYGELFGWKAEEFEGPMDYGTVSADSNGGGIGGGIGSAAEGTDASYQTVYAGVDDVPGTLEKAESLGAKTVVPTMEIPNGPTIALFVDPQGHTFGLVKPQPM
jgi:predicted enzyme related to lactoylglutathione lyase